MRGIFVEKSDLKLGKKNAQFNIVKNDPTKGDGGFGVGTISLENITPIIINLENEEIFIDMGALHGRSRVESKVKFKASKEELVNPYKYWIVWMALEMGEEGIHYSGAAACEIMIAREIEGKKRYGYKSMPEHVNSLDKALKRKYLVNQLDDVSKKLLKNFLVEFNNDYWERSSEELKNNLL